MRLVGRAAVPVANSNPKFKFAAFLFRSATDSNKFDFNGRKRTEERGSRIEREGGEGEGVNYH